MCSVFSDCFGERLPDYYSIQQDVDRGGRWTKHQMNRGRIRAGDHGCGFLAAKPIQNIMKPRGSFFGSASDGFPWNRRYAGPDLMVADAASGDRGGRLVNRWQELPDFAICRTERKRKGGLVYCLVADGFGCPHATQVDGAWICCHSKRAKIIARTKAERS